MERCIADCCERPAESGRKYCHGHRKREKQHKPIDSPLRPWGSQPDDYLQLKALEFARASDEGDRAFRLAWKLLKHAAMSYARRRQKVPTRPKTVG
jgi:hypothetical protein